jgi:uncharacterized protein (TIGR02145 family)
MSLLSVIKGIVQNLKTTKLNNNTAISNIVSSTDWSSLTSTPAYCWYTNNEVAYKPVYGALYNYYAVNTGMLCPLGWHVPSESDWLTLINSLGGSSIAGGKLKETGTANWNSPNTGATNESLFSGVPGGNRWGTNGLYENIGLIGNYWVAKEKDLYNSYLFRLEYNNTIGSVAGYGTKKNGFSVRCIKD